MTKSTLMAMLREQLKLAVYGVQHDITTSELIERDASARFHRDMQRWSRREFLTRSATAAAGAAFLLSLDRVTRAFAQDRKIVIVGAGSAGMVAAYRLQQAGAKVEVYEGSKRIGGRTYTLRSYFAGSQFAEYGAEMVSSKHTNVIKLVQELGGSLTDLENVDGRVQPETYFFGGAEVKRAQILEEFRPVAEAIVNDLKSLTGDVSYATPSNGELLDNLSIAEWLDKRHISGTIRDLLAVACITEYGLELDQQSSLGLLRLVGAKVMENGDNPAVNIFGVSEDRFRIREGSDNAVRKIGARLRKPVIFDHMLEAIKEKSGGGYVLTFQTTNNTVEVDADDVVLAIPFSMLRSVDIQVEMPPYKQQAIQQLGYGVNTKLIVGFGTQVWRLSGTSGTVYSDLPFQMAWETSRGQGNTFGVITNFTGGNTASAVATGDKKDRATEFVADYTKIYPGAKGAYNGKHDLFAWGANPMSLGSYSSYLPGQYTTLRGVEAEPVGRIFFAGEHTSVMAQGTMEGAVESGERVVREILGLS